MLLNWKAGLLPKVQTELEAIGELLRKSPALSTYLTNPTIPRAEKIAKVFKKKSKEFIF